MKRMLYGWGLVLVCLVYAAGCSRWVKVPTSEYGEAGSAKGRVLIATESSDFKDAVLDGVIPELQKDGLYVKVIDVNGLAEEKDSDYQCIVILNTCVAWGLDSVVNRFVETALDKQKIFILVTAGNDEWKVSESMGVDAMTSASESDQTDALAEKVLEEIRSRISS